MVIIKTFRYIFSFFSKTKKFLNDSQNENISYMILKSVIVFNSTGPSQNKNKKQNGAPYFIWFFFFLFVETGLTVL